MSSQTTQPTKKSKSRAVPDHKRLAGPSFPLPIFRKGTMVQVYLGAGWSTGRVIASKQDHCQVTLTMGNRTITVFDARSIRQTESND
jgi:hypothetical protein